MVGYLQNLLSSNNELSNHLPFLDIGQLSAGCDAEQNAEIGDMYSRPMFWIGIYIVVASLLCVVAMAVDLVHGVRDRKQWMPCKYFTYNAAFMTGIAVQLPLDLTSPMPGLLDQAAKSVGLAFMSTTMVNLLPSLASMDNNTLLANVTSLSVFVITLCMSTYIQINTTLISSSGEYYVLIDWDVAAYIYTGSIIMILILTISSSLAIPSFKEIIDSRYEAKIKYLTDEHRQPAIEDAVKRYWVMVQTSSPQFVIMNSPLSAASGLLSLCVMSLNILASVIYLSSIMSVTPTQSPYMWSTYAIFVTQYIGIVVGSISPIRRWYSVCDFKSGIVWNKFAMLLRVEDYWIKILQERKQHNSSSRRSRHLIHNLEDIIITLCILFQRVVVFLCKVISLVPVVLIGLSVTNWVSCRQWLMAMWSTPPITSASDGIDPDLNNYVLKIDDELEIAEKARKYIFTSVNSYISKAEKEQNKNLLQLIAQSNGFEGVKTFDTNQVQPLLPSLEGVHSWSLPIITLTCIAIALPNMHKDEVKNLFESVNEGLSYTHLVEENLNRGRKHVKLQKVSMAVWRQVDNKCEWLGIPLAKDVFKGKKTIETVIWFSDRAKEIVTDNMSTNQKPFENMDNRVIAANSMYRITETILHRFQSIEVTKRQLFAHLKGLIADIFGACFTNIPRVIRMKCCESMTEKREARVKAAANCLGKTSEIRKLLEARQVPLIDVDKLAYIDEWRDLSIP